ncbi:MAG: hypothetical protein M0P64_02630 [Candidatus Pacebacteria bacterium]|jgi:hypothetical protein|nr:hypothetical protein [Candidatus Paceibacterota bacterium]
MTKNTLLIIILSALLLVSVVIWLDSLHGYCPGVYMDSSGVEYCTKRISDYFPEPLVLSILALSLSLLPFSLLTYWTKEEVFRAWWNPAIRFWIPAIVIVTIFTAWMDSGSGAMGVVDFSPGLPILVLLYSLFVITSLVKIIRTYLRTRGK